MSPKAGVAVSPGDRIRALGAADSAAVSLGLQRCVARLNTGAWLDGQNPFRLDPSGNLRTGKRAFLEAHRDELSEYLAASAVIHQHDAWEYLGRALNAVTLGLIPEAIHLAYYSELRASLSLLARNGVVLANRSQYCLAAGGSVVPISAEGTHVAAWQCLSDWATTQAGADAIGAIVVYRGASLRDWLLGSSRAGGSASVVASLMRLFADEGVVRG